MSEMIEVVARAIQASDDEEAAQPLTACACIGREGGWGCPCEVRRASRRARAALEALRVPTQAIRQALRDNLPVDGFDWEYLDADEGKFWSAIVDAALTHTKEDR